MWKIIPGTRYEVSQLGQVRHVQRKQLLRQQLNSKGYLKVTLHGRHYRVSRLVAQAFIPNPENKPQVNHRDGDKCNNSIENLEWVTGAENLQHAWKTGLNVYVCGERNPNAKLSQASVNFIKANRHIKTGELAKQFNVSQATVSLIKHGRTWKDPLL